MSSLSAAYYVLFGASPQRGDVVIIFSARLDETGTDGRSPYAVVAGAIATPPQWDVLETKWRALLGRSGLLTYHFKEFYDGSLGWGDFKMRRFERAQEKIINENALFRVSVGVHRATHKHIKERMRGVVGYHPDSDYGLCLRYLMHTACDQLAKVDPSHRLSVMVEDGPWAKGALAMYERIASMTGKKPAKHAHRLFGFAAIPKGIRPSLEAADYLAGTEHARLMAGQKAKSDVRTPSLLLTAPLLEGFYRGMIEEKERRRAFGKRG